MKIIAIGAGIGGLATGLALQRRGFKVAIYERAAETKETGAGLIITANGRRALRDLGVGDALEAISSCVPVMHACDYATGEILREIRNEQILKQYGIATLQVHRADLHSVLIEAVRAHDPDALHPGHEFIALEQDKASVAVTIANGASDRADAVIGVDGNASAVRSFNSPRARRRNSTARSPSAPLFPMSRCRRPFAGCKWPCIQHRSAACCTIRSAVGAS
jgi:salicylate hydroxylase